MYHEDDLNIAVRFIKKEIFDKVGYFDESLVASEDYDLHNRIVAAGYKVGRIKSKEIHLGEPKSIMEIIRKHYYYGTTLHAFLSKNHEKGLKQLSPLRPAYAKHWKEFVLHPITALGFVVYQIVRYPSAILGYTVVAISKANRRALRVDTH
jgi:GT2 family glycosyltransferase